MKKIILSMLLLIIGLCFQTGAVQAKWNIEKQEWDSLENPIFGTSSEKFTDTTMIYRSGEVYDPYTATTTTYTCTQGIDTEGNVVPISLDCLMPYDFYHNMNSDEKYSFYKKNDEGYVIGTNDPAEAYTIREIAYGVTNSLGEDLVDVRTYTDNNQKERILFVQPTVSVNVTLRIDWDQTNYLLELINADRAEKDVHPLVLDKNVTELAIQRTAELYVLASHTEPDAGFQKWEQMNKGSKLSWLGENVTCSNTCAKYMSSENCVAEKCFADLTKEDVEFNHQGYKKSKGHYKQYMDNRHVAAGLCFASNGFLDGGITAEEFASGQTEDIVPLHKTGLEYRTVTINIIDTAFDYYLYQPLTKLVVGEEHKLANFAAPVDYWANQTFNLAGDEEELAYFGKDRPPFDFSSLTFESSDETVATVNDKGFITAVAPGTVTITTSLQGRHKKEWKITVKEKGDVVEPTPTPTTPKVSDKPSFYNPIVNPAPDEKLNETANGPTKLDYTVKQWKTIIETPKIKKAKNVKKRRISLSWSKLIYEGYTLSKKFKVEYALNKSFTKGKKTKTVTGLKATLSNLKKGKVYYIRIKAYVRTPNGKKMWLQNSKVKKVKVRK